MNIIICNKCKSKFKYSITMDVYPGGKEKESVSCPKCGRVAFTMMTSGIIKTELIK